MEIFATVADKRFIAEWDKLPDVSKERIIRYGFQRIVNDRCGGKDKDEAEKHKLAATVVQHLVDGTTPTRGNGDGADPVTKRMRKNLKAIIKAKKPERFKELNAACETAKDWAKELDAIIAAQKPESVEAMRKKAEEQLERERKDAQDAQSVDVDVDDI